MDRRTFLATAAGAGVAALVGGPAPLAEAATRRKVIYTNIGNATTLRKAQSLLKAAGVPARSIAVFTQHVEQVRTTLPAKALAAGFEDFATRKPKYDPYDLQDIWQAKHPDFPGYNCRITAFGLWSHQMRLQRLNPITDTSLFLDLEALRQDPSALTNRHQLYRFRTLFGQIRTVRSTDPRRHVATLQKSWSQRGIVFRSNPRLKLISVVQHDQIEHDELFTGHIGVLLPASDGLWFLEKLAFQSPYQLTRFSSRSQLNSYLMGMYDTDTTGTTSAPLIMEDQKLMAGYRRVRK